MNQSCAEGRSAQSNMRIVRKPETLFRDPNEVPVQLAILVLVVNRNHPVVTRRQIVHHRRRLMRARPNRRRPVIHGFAHILGPAVACLEDCCSYDAR